MPSRFEDYGSHGNWRGLQGPGCVSAGCRRDAKAGRHPEDCHSLRADAEGDRVYRTEDSPRASRGSRKQRCLPMTFLHTRNRGDKVSPTEQIAKPASHPKAGLFATLGGPFRSKGTGAPKIAALPARNAVPMARNGGDAASAPRRFALASLLTLAAT